MRDIAIPYVLEKVGNKYAARHTNKTSATAFGKTPEEAENRLFEAIVKYIEIYPKRRGEFVNIYMKQITV